MYVLTLEIIECYSFPRQWISFEAFPKAFPQWNNERMACYRCRYDLMTMSSIQASFSCEKKSIRRYTKAPTKHHYEPILSFILTTEISNRLVIPLFLDYFDCMSANETTTTAIKPSTTQHENKQNLYQFCLHYRRVNIINWLKIVQHYIGICHEKVIRYRLIFEHSCYCYLWFSIII